MSAVPKKKLCWNCEGNVSRNIDNCPYCGVYLHASELEEDSSWNPSYRPSSKTEEIPTPIYQSQSEEDTLDPDPDINYEEESSKKENEALPLGELFAQLKRDVFPALFLMAGSIFFLFGVVLLLFSHNGTLTLQWKWDHSFYFLGFALPLIGLGWRYLQQLSSENEK